MALYHVYATVIQKGTSLGRAASFAQYIARETPEHATQFVRYIDRVHGHEDLIDKGEGGLPVWAENSHQFWQMADRYERGGPQRPGTVARTYQITLPRELSPEARLELAADMRATFFERYPHSWAIHNPVNAQGHENPHMHLMLSERRQEDAQARGPELYFRRTAGPGEDPATHGVRKDRSWQGPARLYELRAGVATLMNAALEREGHEVAVSHASLKAQAIEREPAVYRRASDKAQVESEREVLHVFSHPWEQARNVVAWEAQKTREHIRDISREAIVDHVRDRFWQHDQSPTREQERQQSFLRAIDREYARTGRARPVPMHDHDRVHQQGMDLPHVASFDTLGGGGVRIHLYEDERGLRHG